jgi:DNA-binding CsgD family transcriptional regulator
MPTTLCIQVSSSFQPQKAELEFLQGNEWNLQSEQQLLQQIREILSLVRDNTTNVRLELDLTVKDPGEVLFQIRKRLHHPVDISIDHHKLSVREIEILGLIMIGYTNRQIADRLFISFETVRSHRKKILEKTGARNTAALINHYHQTFFEK